jgi:hypothetical protein
MDFWMIINYYYYYCLMNAVDQIKYLISLFLWAAPKEIALEPFLLMFPFITYSIIKVDWIGPGERYQHTFFPSFPVGGYSLYSVLWVWLDFWLKKWYFFSPMYKDAWNVLQIVNIGSGVSLLAVYGPNNYRRTSGTRSVLMHLTCFLIRINLQLKCFIVFLVTSYCLLSQHQLSWYFDHIYQFCREERQQKSW